MCLRRYRDAGGRKMFHLKLCVLSFLNSISVFLFSCVDQFSVGVYFMLWFRGLKPIGAGLRLYNLLRSLRCASVFIH